MIGTVRSDRFERGCFCRPFTGPRQLSQILSLFILRNGTIDCIDTGGRRYSADLRFTNFYCNPYVVLEVIATK